MANRKQIHNTLNDSLRATTTVLRITIDIPIHLTGTPQYKGAIPEPFTGSNF